MPVWNLLELPDAVTYQQAALLESASVAMHAIRGILGETDFRRLEGQNDSHGIKVLGVQKLYAIGNKDAQRDMTEKLGVLAEDFCDTRREEPLHWMRQKTQGQGVDVFLECVGKNDTVKLALDAAAPSGRIMLVGNPASDMALDRDTYWKILRKQLTLRGTWNSSYLGEERDDWHMVLRMISEDRLHPEKLITHRFPLEDLQKGLLIMRDKSEDYVKIMTILS